MSNYDREIGSNVEDDPNAGGITPDVSTPRADEVHPVEPTNRFDTPNSGVSTSPTGAGNDPEDTDLEEDEDTDSK